MRNEDGLQKVALQAKTWYTKKQQELPTIRETRLPNEVEYGIYQSLYLCIFLIGCVLDTSQTIEFRNRAADTLVGKQMQIKDSTGKTYVETNYTTDYVIFSQNV